VVLLLQLLLLLLLLFVAAAVAVVEPPPAADAASEMPRRPSHGSSSAQSELPLRRLRSRRFPQRAIVARPRRSFDWLRSKDYRC